MQYLITSVLASVTVSVLLKIIRRNQGQIPLVVGVNYLMAMLLCVAFLKPSSNISLTMEGFGILLGLGLMLPLGFVVMSRAVEQVGIVKADAAQRLSLVLTLLVAFFIWKEPTSAEKLFGILVALLALACLIAKPSESTNSPLGSVYLFLVWFTYGVCDLLLKLLSKTSGQSTATTLTLAFALAFVLMSVYVLIIRQIKIRMASLWWGAALGLLNFINIFTYIKAHQQMKDNPSLVFTTMNIGVIALGTLVGALLFREKLRPLALLGIVLAMCAVWIIYA